MASHVKRPRDPIQLAKLVGDIATGQADAPKKESPRATAGRLGGIKGGTARMSGLSSEERSALARKAARTRWPKAKS